MKKITLSDLKVVLAAMLLLIVLIGDSLTLAQSKGKANGTGSPCRIEVGDNVRVSDAPASPTSPTAAFWETYIAVNPKDKNNLIVSSYMGEKGDKGVKRVAAFYFSKDGGRIWKRTKIIGSDGKVADEFPEGGDPSVLFSKAGTAFFQTYTAGKGNSYNVIYRSFDGGRTAGPQEKTVYGYDHPMPAADLTDGPYGGNLYFFALAQPGNERVGYNLGLIRSRTDGLDWTSRVVVRAVDIGLHTSGEFKREKGLQVDNNGILISRTGKLFLHFKQFDLGARGDNKARWWITTSDDGGSTFSKPHILTKKDGTDLISTTTGHNGSSIDASNGPYKGRLYSVWKEKVETGGGKKVYLSYSADDGATWAEPKEMTGLTGVGENLSFLSDVEVSVNNLGVVLVSAYKFNETGPWSTNEKGAREIPMTHQRYATASLDGGATFLPAVPVASAPTEFFRWINLHGDNAYSPEARIILGDYLNVAEGPDGTFHALWMDGRKETQQLYYAPVRVTCNAKPAVATEPSAAVR